MDLNYDTRQRRRQEGRRAFGLIIAAAGVVLLLHTVGLFQNLNVYFYEGWPIVLVVIGFLIGIRSRFRNNVWWILMLIGSVHILQPYLFRDIPTHRIIWPALLIGAGLMMFFRKRTPDKWKEANTQLFTNDADTINIDVTFGGRKEIITSRTFRGGRIRASFAGAEVNLAAADSGIQPMVIEVHASFAGVEIIVPSHWEIQNEINPTMGSVEDHRMIHTADASTEKRTLVLRGSCSFGSVEIKSY